MRLIGLILASAGLLACAAMPDSDPLVVDVAGIETLQSEGAELRLLVSIRIQNPNDLAVEYDGAAIDLDVNGRRLASGVSDEVGTIPRYGEAVLAMPVTISAFNVARQIIGVLNRPAVDEVSYRLRGKLEAGFLGTRRFTYEGVFEPDLSSLAL